MSEDEPKVSRPDRPDASPDESGEKFWQAHWQSIGQPWRTEPDIDAERQAILRGRKATTPDRAQGAYPFGGMQLNRADIEWLLGDHESGRGPVDWRDERQRSRYGLDLRGANLRGADLHALPLARLIGGLTPLERRDATAEQCEQAALHLEEVDLHGVHLEGAVLVGAHLQGARITDAFLEHATLQCAQLADGYLRGSSLAGADLRWAHLERADLRWAHLERADLRWAHLERAALSHASLPQARLEAHLEGADLTWSNLEGARLLEGHFEGVNLYYARLDGANLNGARLEGADLRWAHLKRASLNAAHLEGAHLFQTHLDQADLTMAHLQGAQCQQAHFEGANLDGARLNGQQVTPDELKRMRDWSLDYPPILPPANLSGAFFDSATNLAGIVLGDRDLGYVALANVHWGDTSLAAVDWAQLVVVGDEREARHPIARDGSPKGMALQLEEYRAAVQSNRQLAAALHAQGLNEEAAYFTYRAQVLQRRVLRQQRKRGAYFLSWFLFLIAGYGYRPRRSMMTYALVVVGFALAYYALGRTIGPSLSPQGSLVLSIVSFHGRGFFPQSMTLDDPIMTLVAAEAIIGLLIEIAFIATFTQRFFTR